MIGATRAMSGRRHRLAAHPIFDPERRLWIGLNRAVLRSDGSFQISVPVTLAVGEKRPDTHPEREQAGDGCRCQSHQDRASVARDSRSAQMRDIACARVVVPTCEAVPDTTGGGHGVPAQSLSAAGIGLSVVHLLRLA